MPAKKQMSRPGEEINPNAYLEDPVMRAWTSHQVMLGILAFMASEKLFREYQRRDRGPGPGPVPNLTPLTAEELAAMEAKPPAKKKRAKNARDQS